MLKENALIFTENPVGLQNTTVAVEMIGIIHGLTRLFHHNNHASLEFHVKTFAHHNVVRQAVAV